MKLILDLATRYDVDGVWAGWGHASEYPELPGECWEREGRYGGFVWMGNRLEDLTVVLDKCRYILWL